MPDPLPTLSPPELARYSRHILLEEVGVEGQRRLGAARMLIIGAGGLGSPAALYLAAAGVGTIGLADFDRVEAHNLQRQLLHDTDSVGTPKVVSGARRMRAINPHVRVVQHGDGITAANAVALFSEYDVILDGTDRFAARYLNNDAAFFAQRPLVHGSVFKFEGQVTLFAPARGGPCYRCLFPEPPPSGSVPGCGEAGVLGAVCGVIGSLQALEALKLILGIGEPLLGRLLTYDARGPRFHTLTMPRDPACPLCGPQPSIRALEDVPLTDEATVTMSPDEVPLEIPVAAAKQLRDADPAGTIILDVREPHELEICAVAGAEHVPMRQIPERIATLPRDKHLLVLCHVGGRSLRVTHFLRQQGFAAVSNIAGGIDAWATEIEPGMQRY